METLPKSYVVTAAIDFGTSCSGYAYSYQDENEIYVNANWKDGSQSFKVPTAILFDGQENFRSFGYEAENEYNDYADETEEHEYMFFHRFKMILYEEKSLSRDLELKAYNGKSMNALRVFSSAISYLKNHLLKTVNNARTGPCLSAANIYWVLTVPAIWSETSKFFMIEASKMAGINKDDLLIALEPECASIYCKIACIKELPQNTSTAGAIYMVIDIGGGTVDFTLHEINENGTVRELTKASGNDAGGTSVDRKFEGYLVEILTKPVIEYAKNVFSSEWIDVKREFERIKRSVSSSDEASQTVIINLDSCLDEAYDACYGMSISEAFKRGKIKKKHIEIQGKGRIRVCKKDIHDMIKDITVQIMESIEELLNKSENIKLDYVILAGGFSNSSIVLKEIQKFFGKVPVVRPEEAELAVLRGAVLYGLKPNQITSRISRRTYGISDYREPSPEDPEDHISCYKQDENIKVCVYFKTLATIGDSIEIGKKITMKCHTKKYDSSYKTQIAIYASKNKTVKYCNEEGVYEVGRLELPHCSKTGGDVEISFGKTNIQMSFIEKASGNTFQADFDFLTS